MIRVDPLKDGVMRPGKTEEDRLPVSERPRVHAAKARLALRQQGR